MSQNSVKKELIKRSFTEMMKDVGTSIPGHILAFDPDTQLAQIQMGVEGVKGDGSTFNPPPLIECPVYFPGGAGGAIEFQIDAGDEGVVLFSQRCIDAWVDTGGIAKNPIMRFHDFSDAYFLPGLRSQGNKLTGFNNDGIRVRNVEGDAYFWLKSDKSVEMVSGSGSFMIDAATGIVTINGVTIDPAGVVTAPTVAATTSLTVVGLEMGTHKHGGVATGGGTSGGPVP